MRYIEGSAGDGIFMDDVSFEGGWRLARKDWSRHREISSAECANSCVRVLMRAGTLNGRCGVHVQTMMMIFWSSNSASRL